MVNKEHIENAIKEATALTSGLDEEIRLNVRGFAPATVRHLFHALTKSEEPITYLEVGLFCGASFCSSFNKNVTSIGVENHSQDFSEGFEQVAKELKENVEKFKDNAKEVGVHYEDCYAMDKSILPDNIDIYFYDGWHSEEMQAKALPFFLDKMADKFVWVVDDFNWDYVASGTAIGLTELRDKIEVEKLWVLRGYQLQNDPIWHNGLCIYLINKKK